MAKTLGLELQAAKGQVFTMRSQLDAANKREVKLKTDLEMAAQLTRHVASVEATLARERQLSLKTLETLRGEIASLGDDRTKLRATCTALQAENDAHRLELAEQRTELEAQVAAECAKRAGQY